MCVDEDSDFDPDIADSSGQQVSKTSARGSGNGRQFSMAIKIILFAVAEPQIFLPSSFADC